MFIFSNVKVVGLLGFLALSLSSAEVSASRLRGPHRRHLSKTKSNKGREKASKASNPDHYVLPVSGDAPSLEEERMFYYDEKPTSEISDTKKDKRDGLGVLEGHPQMKHNSEKTTKAEETSDTMSNQLGEWSNIDDPEDPGKFLAQPFEFNLRDAVRTKIPEIFTIT
mgnify:CR=1 FL=1